MSEIQTDREENNGNSALDWEIFDVLCQNNFELNVSESLFLLSFQPKGLF